MRKLFKVVILSLLLVSFAAAALADVPYASYSYDEWDRSVSAPVGYTVEKTVYGAMTQFGTTVNEAPDLTAVVFHQKIKFFRIIKFYSCRPHKGEITRNKGICLITIPGKHCTS